MTALTKNAEDGLRRRYIEEWSVYQQYMEDQESQIQQKQKVSIPNPSRPPGKHKILTKDTEIHRTTP